MRQAESKLGGRFRYALVGAGRIGSCHAEAIGASSSVELVAYADPRQPEAAVFAGLDRFDDCAGLIASGGFDAAIVATPTATHLEIAGQLIAAGVPVLCEKPCGISVAEVAELERLAVASGVEVAPGYWRRHLPELRRLAAEIAAGELGELSMLLCQQWDEAPPPPAFRDPLSSGGIVVDMGVHELDMLRWLTGAEILALRGLLGSAGDPAPELADAYTANFAVELDGGLTAAVSLARRHPPGELCRIEVLGSSRAVALDLLRPQDAERRLLDALRAQAEAFALQLRGGPRQGATLADARAAMAAAELAAGWELPSGSVPTAGRVSA